MAEEEVQVQVMVDIASMDIYREETVRRLADEFRRPGVPLSEEAALLRKQTLYQIENEPETFNMCTWDSSATRASSVIDALAQATATGHCGTTRCLAGWALYLAGQPVTAHEAAVAVEEIEARAVRVLELTQGEYLGAPGDKPLFFTTSGYAVTRLAALAQ